VNVGPLKVVIAWPGLPYYAARVIAEAVRKYPDAKFTVITTKSKIPYLGVDHVALAPVIRVDAGSVLSWRELGLQVPDLYLLTSWEYRGFMSLARDVSVKPGGLIICMVDNYFYGKLKQWVGAIYFRLYLRRLYDYMLVPGVRSKWFMHFLGMPKSRVFIGNYTADPDIFYSPREQDSRSGVLFVGQFIERKGVRIIIETLCSAQGEKYASSMRLIGSGPLGELLVSNGLFVEGFKQAPELGMAYRESSVLLLPSVRDHWGVVAHEAALCGCLIIATRQCGCVDDLVEHGVNGYIMENCSKSELLRALEWHDALTEARMLRGRAVSLAKASFFSPHNWAENLAKMDPRLRG